MGMFDIINLLASKDGNEAFEKVKEILENVGIDVNNEDGSVKDLYTVIREVAEVWNNNTK